MITKPVTESCKNEFTPISVKPFLNICKVKIPATAPPIVPIPPLNEVPPIIAAAIANKSNPLASLEAPPFKFDTINNPAIAASMP